MNFPSSRVRGMNIFRPVHLCCRATAIASFVVLIGTLAYGQVPDRPKYGPGAVRLYEAREYVQRNPAPDFWALIPYYAAQPDDRSCSAASVCMLANALRVERSLGADEPLVTQAALLESVPADQWRDKVAPGGEGLSLGELAAVIPRALAAFGIGAEVEMVRFADESAAAKRRLRELLVENERSGRDLILVNFLQSRLTGDPEGAVGHIAPIGAYDAERRRVLILDPDRQWYEPYWVSEETLLSAMATTDPVSGGPRGLVHVSIRADR